MGTGGTTQLSLLDYLQNRQFPILPARLQTSTFGLWMLNYCVRYGNRWNHLGNITGYFVEIFSQNYTEDFHDTNIPLFERSTSANQFRSSSSFLGTFSPAACFPIASALGQACNKISPRHISISPLHPLRNFHS